MTDKKTPCIDVHCTCGHKVGEVFGFFRLMCHKKKDHEGKKVIVYGYTDQGKCVVEGITPEMVP